MNPWTTLYVRSPAIRDVRRTPDRVQLGAVSAAAVSRTAAAGRRSLARRAGAWLFDGLTAVGAATAGFPLPASAVEDAAWPRPGAPAASEPGRHPVPLTPSWVAATPSR